jgi:hypothetical protein
MCFSLCLLQVLMHTLYSLWFRVTTGLGRKRIARWFERSDRWVLNAPANYRELVLLEYLDAR